MAYCTEAEAREAGAVGSSAEVLAAIAQARTLVDRATGQWWEPTAATLSSRFHRGVALLLFPPVTVTEVNVGGVTLDPAAYLVRSPAVTPGAASAVELVTGGADLLIAGAEPYLGGWAGFASRHEGRLVEVVGTFGHPAGDVLIRDAAAALAAWLTTGGSPPVTADDEGNTLTVTADPQVAETGGRRSTGLPLADGILAPRIARRVMIS